MSVELLSRRTVLRVLAWVTLGGLSLSGRHALSAGRGSGAPSEAARWRPLVPSRVAPIAIGEKVLRGQPHLRDTGTLLGSLGLPRGSGAVSDSELEHERGRLRARHRADFAEGRVHELSGWLLSETELRLAALIAVSR